MNYPAIVLAGGLGTRLSKVVGDVPKPMAPVNGFPFLHYLFIYLQRQGIKEAILSVGHLHESILNYFGNVYMGIAISYSVEETLLGTGGGMMQAFNNVAGDEAFVLNGDTFFDIALHELHRTYTDSKAIAALALKEMYGFDRYGTVDTDEEGRIIAFNEKAYKLHGLINGGVYFMHKKIFEGFESGQRFSFEKDVLESHVNEIYLQGKIFDGYFIDIGIPEDYARAQNDFKRFTS